MVNKTIEKWEGNLIDIRGVGEIIYAEYGNNDNNPMHDAAGILNAVVGGKPGFKRMVDVTEKVRSFLTNNHRLYFQVNNDNMGGDPCNGMSKKVIIHYKDYDTTPYRRIVDDKSNKDIHVSHIKSKPSPDILNNISSSQLYHNGGYAAYIAIDKYQNVKHLNSCVNDAELLESFLSKQGFVTLDKILQNEHATKKNIEEFLDEISIFLKDKKESSFILYLAGHGIKKDSGGNFLCHDFSSENMISTSIDYEVFNNFSKNFASKHQLFIVDACFSGSLINYDLRETPWKNKYLHKKGLHALTSVENSGKAFENEKNGIFTKSFIDVLSNLLNEKNFVRISELENLIKEKISENLKNMGIQSNPNCFPKFGRLFDKVNSLDDINEMIDVNGELIFFKNELLPDNISTRGATLRFKWKKKK